VRTLSSYLSREVVTQSGARLGRCRDLRGELTSTTLRVTGLYVGRYGLLQRLGIPSHRRVAFIPWRSVTAIEAKRIVVRDDASGP
jgi:sporulation protein YlmC with PRC-barrel domain